MLWAKRFLLILALHGLSGCGFKPMLEKPKEPNHVALNVTGVEGYLNHLFYQELQQHLNLLSLKKPLTVKIVLSQTLYDISYGKDATALRSQNVLLASYEVSTQGNLLRKGKVDAISSYNLDRNDEFSTLTGRMGADEKVIKSIAFEVAREILLSTR